MDAMEIEGVGEYCTGGCQARQGGRQMWQAGRWLGGRCDGLHLMQGISPTQQAQQAALLTRS